jgi:hypothetical protein
LGGLPRRKTVKEIIEKLKAEIDQAPIDDFDSGWNAAIRNAIIIVEQAAQPTRAPDAANRRCPECGALLEDKSVYCDTCGTDTPRR